MYTHVFSNMCLSCKLSLWTKCWLYWLQCEICMLAMPCWDRPVLMSCNHRFCTSCWESYLTVKIQDGDAHHILCPAYQCHILVPVEVIEKLVSPDMARRYLQFDIKVKLTSFSGRHPCEWCTVYSSWLPIAPLNTAVINLTVRLL